MAYQNISFPLLKLIHEFRTEREIPSTIVTNFAKEYRINRYSQAKARFTYPSRNMTNTDWVTLKTFFETVGWQRDSFNFTIPGTTTIVKVRLDSIPSMQYIALDKDNKPTMVNVGDISLKQVFNE